MRLSYSSINTYETCPAKFKFQYEDRVPQARSAALSFGDSLHRALYLFHNRPVPVPPSIGELHDMLEASWVSEGFGDASEEQTYRDHGRQVLSQYHRENADAYRIPAALEFRFTIEVEGVALSGVIDRMDRIPGGGYEIVDYKTNRRLPPQSRIDQDLQLSIYHMAARQIWGIEPERLTLYYLLPGQRMTTVRTPPTSTSSAGGSRWSPSGSRPGSSRRGRTRSATGASTRPCARCSATGTRRQQGDPTPRVTEMVDEWIRLKRETRAAYRRFDELVPLINAFADEHGYRRLFGSDGAAIDRRAQHVTAPIEEKVREILEPLGLWEQVLSVDPTKLNALIESRTLSPDVEDALLASREEVRTQHALYLREAERARR